LVTGRCTNRFYTYGLYHWSSGKHLLGSDAFQETDIIGISTPVTKWNYQITDAAEIPEIMAKAFISKSGRPGPVLMI
jgi:acetolactate synthase-1/2/3 large subunit